MKSDHFEVPVCIKLEMEPVFFERVFYPIWYRFFKHFAVTSTTDSRRFAQLPFDFLTRISESEVLRKLPFVLRVPILPSTAKMKCVQIKSFRIGNLAFWDHPSGFFEHYGNPLCEKVNVAGVRHATNLVSFSLSQLRHGRIIRPYAQQGPQVVEVKIH